MCTENPEELAWLLGVEENELQMGPKPEDLNLVECHEEWSHTGTPQWACREEAEASEEQPRKFQPLRALLRRGASKPTPAEA